MTDHDLGDLIIGESEAKTSSKSKGILTIVALLIAILVIAIMMAQMVLEESDSNNSIEELQEKSIVSSELQLDESFGESQNEKDGLDELSNLLNDKNETNNSTNEVKPDIKEVNEEDTTAVAPIVAPKNIETKKPKEETKKPKEPTVTKKPQAVKKPEHVNKPKPAKKPEPQKSHISKGSFYIQVGSFSNKPSSRFLSVITKNGFSYKLHNSGKLLIGAYSSRGMANRDLARVKDRINKGAFVINIK